MFVYGCLKWTLTDTHRKKIQRNITKCESINQEGTSKAYLIQKLFCELFTLCVKPTEDMDNGHECPTNPTIQSKKKM